VNEGGDKVAQSELRASASPVAVLNSVWDGTGVHLMSARNETVNFNTILEASGTAMNAMSVSMGALTGPGGYVIDGRDVTSNDDVYNYVGRNIEQFYVRYLPIQGLSSLSYETYDERHVPKRMRRPWTGAGIGSGTWANRPDHDKNYPDIAVPAEWVGEFNIATNSNQSIWTDVYVPTAAPAGVYHGVLDVRRSGVLVESIPVDLTVRSFALPETPSSKTMVYLGYPDIATRYTGTQWPNAGTTQAQTTDLVRDRHFQMAHRHRLSMVDSNDGSTAWSSDAPRPEWTARLNGSLFTSAKGYDGPGAGVGNGVYSIGTYGQWSWKSGATQSTMNTHTNAWQTWFDQNSPGTEAFLYLVDESTNYAQTEQWASWVKNNPGAGGRLKTFATLDLPHANSSVPSLGIAASWFSVADPSTWGPAKSAYDAAGKSFMVYNGKRPAEGSFATEDDGVALREQAWAQKKMGVRRWFFWESTYYNDYQGGRGQTDVFHNAQTFGGAPTTDSVRGKSGWNYANGDGLLFYPGTDTVYPSSSYGQKGPIASLRMKYWRRGIQDVDYITLAAQRDPVRTQAIISRMVPKALWENGISDPADPTWVRGDISWSINPDDWETARAQLADIIEGK